MRAITACKAIISILRTLNRWNIDEINQIYNLAHKYIRENELKKVE